MFFFLLSYSVNHLMIPQIYLVAPWWAQPQVWEPVLQWYDDSHLSFSWLATFA